MNLRTEHMTVTKSSCKDGFWHIEDETGAFSISCADVERGIWSNMEPKKGDSITLYLTGSFIRGCDINGERIFLVSDEENEARRVYESMKQKRMDAERLEREKPRLDAEYQALPQVFKERIDRFRNNNPNFRASYESYEMFCCTEAVKIAENVKRLYESGEYADEIDDFWDDPEQLKLAAYPDNKPWKEPENPVLRVLWWGRALHSKAYRYNYDRHREVTGISDEHSGNTAGAAFALAQLYIDSPEFVSKLHGALSPLVGSEAYGDINPETGEVG